MPGQTGWNATLSLLSPGYLRQLHYRSVRVSRMPGSHQGNHQNSDILLGSRIDSFFSVLLYVIFLTSDHRTRCVLLWYMQTSASVIRARSSWVIVHRSSPKYAIPTSIWWIEYFVLLSSWIFLFHSALLLLLLWIKNRQLYLAMFLNMTFHYRFLPVKRPLTEKTLQGGLLKKSLKVGIL